MTKKTNPAISPKMAVNTAGLNVTLSPETLPIKTSSTLTITLTNQLGQAITFNSADLSPPINVNKIPFTVMIDPSLLTSDEFEQIIVSSPITYGNGNNQSTSITTAFTTSYGFNYLCISPTSDVTLQEGDQLTITLTNVDPSTNGVGSSGSLTFGYNGKKSQGGGFQNSVGNPLTLINSSTSNPSLLDHLEWSISGGQGPSSDLLYVSDGTEEISNKLTLTLSNKDGSNPLVQDPVSGPQFMISFVTTEEGGDGSVNAFGTVSDVQNIVIDPLIVDNNNYGWNPPQKNTQGPVPTWTLTPKSTNTGIFGPQGSMNIPIDGIVSHTNPGYTNIYLSYVNIGGYEDGSMAIPVQKRDPVPTISSFLPDKSSYEFFETITFNYAVFGADTWSLQISDPAGTIVYNNPSVPNETSGTIHLQPLSFPSLSSSILSNLGTYTAKLSNTDGNQTTSACTFSLQNNSTVALNSLNIITDSTFNIQSDQSSMSVNWNAPDSIPGEGFFLKLWVTAINNGQTLATPCPITLANNVLSSSTDTNVKIDLSGNIEALQPLMSSEPLTFELQLMYGDLTTPVDTSIVSTQIECPSILNPTASSLSVDSSGNVMPYASYITAQWHPLPSGGDYYVTIEGVDGSGNTYPLSYYFNTLYNDGSTSYYALPTEATNLTFLIASLNQTSAGTEVTINLNMCSDSAGKNIVSSTPIKIITVAANPVTFDVQNPYADIFPFINQGSQCGFSLSWNIPGPLAPGVVPENFFITAVLTSSSENSPPLPVNLGNYPEYYPLYFLTDFSASNITMQFWGQLNSSFDWEHTIFFNATLNFGNVQSCQVLPTASTVIETNSQILNLSIV